MTAKQRQEVERRCDATNRIWTHYDHACEKHPHFCDSLLPDYLLRDNIKERAPYISGYRKWSDGKIRRHIEWLRASERRR